MNYGYLNLEQDSYKELLKHIKQQSIMGARIHMKPIERKAIKKQVETQQRVATECALPSIHNNTLQDISKHFHLHNKSIRGSPRQLEELTTNKSSQRFIQQSFSELQQTTMGVTMRQVDKFSRRSSNQRAIATREPLTVRQLEIKLGSVVEQKLITSSRQSINKQRNSEILKESIDQQIYYEELLSSTSFAVPSRCESSQMILIRDKVYVYGGMSGAGLTTDLWTFDMKKMEWNLVACEIDIRLTDHSMVTWKQYLILFGGAGYYDHKMKIRQVYSTLVALNTITLQWTTNLESVDPRRQHKACIWNHKYMIVTGGIDAADGLLTDTWMYSLDSKKWIGSSIHFTEGLAHHAICQGYDFKRGVETVYLFGGKTKSLDSFPLMRIVFQGGQLHLWERVPFAGISPPGRYNHTMENINDSLVLIGGRSQSDVEYQDKIHLFNLQWGMWTTVKKEGLLSKRWGHASVVYNTQILCFGGINEVSYLPSNIFGIETDPHKIRGRVQYLKKKSIVVPKQLSPQPKANNLLHFTSEGEMKNREPGLICKLEKFRNHRLNYEKALSYMPKPELKAPKMRYDILMHFVRKVLIEIGYVNPTKQ